MTDTSVTIIEQPSRQQIARREAATPGKVTGRLKRALDLMVWDNITDNEAAVQTGLTVTAIRLALRRPHVRAHYHSQLEVLRTRESSRTIHTFIEVRDQKSNQMARVAAGKALQQLEDQPQGAGARSSSPGFVIQIVNAPGSHMPHMRVDEAKSLISHEPVTRDGKADD